jgi:hypothetical protein
MLFGVLIHDEEEILITRPSTSLNTALSLKKEDIKGEEETYLGIHIPDAKKELMKESNLVFHTQPHKFPFLEQRLNLKTERLEWAVTSEYLAEARKQARQEFYTQADPLRHLQINGLDLHENPAYLELSHEVREERKRIKNIYRNLSAYFIHRYGCVEYKITNT